MTPVTGPKACSDRRSGYSPQAARASSARLNLALIGFQRRLTRRRWLPRLASPAATYRVETCHPQRAALPQTTRCRAAVTSLPGGQARVIRDHLRALCWLKRSLLAKAPGPSVGALSLSAIRQVTSPFGRRTVPERDPARDL